MDSNYARFMSRIIEHEGHWIWQPAFSTTSTPTFSYYRNGRALTMAAHRWIWQHVHQVRLGRGARLKCVCHQMGCVNPNHYTQLSPGITVPDPRAALPASWPGFTPHATPKSGYGFGTLNLRQLAERYNISPDSLCTLITTRSEH